MWWAADSLAMVVPSSETSDEALDRILLDIRLLGANRGWGESATRSLREKILASHDEDVKEFVAALERRRDARPWGLILMGVGELVLGAFLTVGGLILVVPAVLGFTSRGEVARYLSDLSLGLSSSALSDPLIIGLGFAFSLFLILAALYTLRQASRNFRQTGVVSAPE